MPIGVGMLQSIYNPNGYPGACVKDPRIGMFTQELLFVDW
jgi:hypothetical protein